MMQKFSYENRKIMILQLKIIYLLSIVSVLHAKNITQKDIEWRKNRFVREESEPIHFTEEEKKLFVDLHNKYRGSNLNPPAADMQYLEWDENLENVAQEWADKCIIGHGNTKHLSVKGPMGQNLYFGSRNPNNAMMKWFGEYADYDYQALYCQSNKQCGHYTQIVWANTGYVGCALKMNCNTKYKYHVVCNYYPAGNVKGVRPYKVGLPCSKCSKTNDGFCSDKLCVTKSQCEKYKLKCEAVDQTKSSNTCDGKICANGYILNINSCSCYLLNQGSKSNDATSASFTILLIVIIALVVIVL